MSIYAIMQFLHVLAATVWIGGHLVLALAYLPAFVRGRDVESLFAFEKKYHVWGMGALVVAVLTGLAMAHVHCLPVRWLSFSGGCLPVSLKLLFLLVTVGLAVDARLRLLRCPKPESRRWRIDLAIHIGMVTVLGVGFLVLGWLIRFG